MAVNSGLSVKKKRGPGKPFQPGQSGNPGGRPSIPADVVEASRALTATALATLEDVCANGQDEKARIAAAVALLDRAWGKPTEHREITGAERAPLELTAVTLSPEERLRRITDLLDLAKVRRDASGQPALARPGGAT